jgi:acetyl-CoA carboxylase carboxyl transferase subunit alpha
MPELILDFEKPIAELENKLRELQELSSSSNMRVDDEISTLTAKVEKTKKEIYDSLTPWQRVQLARHPKRPYTMDYINEIFTDFIELHGDRRFAEDPAVVGGLAKLDGAPVVIIGTQKGRNTKENVFRNFGCPHPEGYRKALRIMKIADRARLPVICLIDTPGAFPGIASEERHIGEAIAVNLKEMFSLSVPVLATVIGEGGSGGALGIGIGNRILLMENAYYSVITPEGCAAILWKDRKYTAQAAESLKLTAKDLIKLRIVDEIIEEPLGGAHKHPLEATEMLKKALVKNIKSLKGKSSEELINQRYEKYRSISYLKESGKNESAPEKK